MSDKNKARVNAFYFYHLPPRFLSRKTHGVSLYAKLRIFLNATIEYAKKHNAMTYGNRKCHRQLWRADNGRGTSMILVGQEGNGEVKHGVVAGEGRLRVKVDGTTLGGRYALLCADAFGIIHRACGEPYAPAVGNLA